MTVPHSLFPSVSGRASIARFGLACLLAFSSIGAVRAATERPRELTEKTSAALQKLKPLLDGKDWNGALALLQGLEPSAAPDSYDTFRGKYGPVTGEVRRLAERFTDFMSQRTGVSWVKVRD